MPKKRKKTRKDAFDIAIGGEGVSPSSVGIRALAELLQAAASVIERVAKAKGVEPPVVSLAEVTDGSAAYKLDSESDTAGAVFTQVYDFAKKRGVGAPPAVRDALKRLHGEASKVGPLKIQARLATRAQPPKAILVAVPVEDDAADFEACEEVHGRLVGLYAERSGRLKVQVRLAEGRTEEFLCDTGLVDAARKLFNEPVRARVVYAHRADAAEPLLLESLDPWAEPERDFVDALEDFRRELTANNLEVDSSAWLRDLHHG